MILSVLEVSITLKFHILECRLALEITSLKIHVFIEDGVVRFIFIFVMDISEHIPLENTVDE